MERVFEGLYTREMYKGDPIQEVQSQGGRKSPWRGCSIDV